MTVAEFLDKQLDDQVRTFDWRADRLTDLGLPEQDACDLALSVESWHDVERLIAGGCPPRLVAEILL